MIRSLSSEFPDGEIASGSLLRLALRQPNLETPEGMLLFFLG
jgi:hypothetical protein